MILIYFEYYIGANVHSVDIRGRSPIQLAQSKLKLLRQCSDDLIKTKVEQVKYLHLDNNF